MGKNNKYASLPKVSVFMIAYNHENFIAQAIESVMAQKTSFPVELVIGEDCSTDNTRRICLDYKNKFPDRIKLLLPEKNLGVKENCRQTLARCNGEYVAWLEGDDYWTDENKLQLQVEFLEKNKDYSLCFHREVIVDEKNKELAEQWRRELKGISTINDICRGNFICSNTVVFRNYDDIARTFSVDSDVFDWPLWVVLSNKGKIGFIDKKMSAYRVHKGGIFSMKSKSYQYILGAKAAYEWKKIIGTKKCNKEFVEIVLFYYGKIIKTFFVEREYKNMVQYIMKGLACMLDHPIASLDIFMSYLASKIFFQFKKLI